MCECACHGHHAEGAEASACGHHHETTEWGRIGIAAAIFVAGMVLNATDAALFRTGWVRFLWFAAAYVPIALPVFRAGFAEMRRGAVFNEFLLMVLASIGAFWLGEYPEAVAVMLFYAIGESLQEHAVHRATGDIRRLLDVRPDRATVVRNGQLCEVDPREVAVDEEIEVRPGGRVPLDGRLLTDEAAFDTSALTGESLPRELQSGDDVSAGSIVCGRAVRLRVTQPFDRSTLARVLESVREAAARKAPAERFIRRFARIYTPAVVAAAAAVVVIPLVVSWVVPSFVYVFNDWFYRALVFLVISCPCALVISVPLSYFAGIGAAARTGVLFKGGQYVDALADVRTVVFDKTGTLTVGTFAVVESGARTEGATDWLRLLRAAEAKSTHPLARAAVAYAEAQGAAAVEPDAVSERAGFGVEARVEGRRVVVGNLRLMEQEGVAVPTEAVSERGTTVVCAVDGRYEGHLTLADTLKPDARQALTDLRTLGATDIHMLSGDKPEIVRNFAAELGIDHAEGGLLPTDKVAAVEKLMERTGQGKVAFVGDGMNDAAALALSDVGIAMGGMGTDAAIESADVVIQTDRPARIATALKIARATRRIVLQNITGAVGVKVAVLLAGMAGYASLWGAVFADVGVALLAVVNALRLVYRK